VLDPVGGNHGDVSQPHVPTLVGGSAAAASAAATWREDLRAVRADACGLDPEAMGLPPVAVALVTDGTGPFLKTRLADPEVLLVGLLAPEPLESLAWASSYGADRAYLDLPALVGDRVEVVVVDLAGTAGLRTAEVLVDAGLGVVLTRPEPSPVSVLRDLAATAEVAGVAVGAVLGSRTRPSVAVLADEIPRVAPLRQVTVTGWPIGAAARLHLVDLVRRLAGDVVAVCAAPGAMPATSLGDRLPVTLALLTNDAVTVLVSESADGHWGSALVTASGTGRLVLQGDQVLRQDARGVLAVPVSEAPACAVGRLAGLLAAGDLGSAASLADLLAASRVLDIARASLEAGCWLEN